ncbi:rhodanese-like domain-containing protein [Halocynthiibacter sp.]|uniref:rhodanese-like domain-containing protein n=1 Tax=Halocynthiibacter sp. TaxID=1979210 RepID=UPI003C40B727
MTVTPIQKLLETARAEITTLSIEDAMREVDSGSALLVDIRDIRELQREGRINNAFHAPRGMLEFWVAPDSPYHKAELSDGRRLILFCASAWRSALSTKTLQDMGLDNVAELEGGFKAWVAAGNAVVKPD